MWFFRRRREAQAYRAFQQLVSTTLLAWGGLNVIAGTAALCTRNAVLRHIGLQAITWGGIDAALALLGRRNAARARGSVTAQARSFQRIVAVNAGLDVLYILGGRALITGAKGRATRAGAGVGVIVQGVFLLLFDSALVLAARRWTKRR